MAADFETGEDLFGEIHEQWTSYHPPVTQKEEPVVEEKLRPALISPPMWVENKPPGWVMNVRKDHSDSGRECRADSGEMPTVVLPCCCVKCTVNEHPYLMVGDPVQTHPAVPAEDLEQNYVGLYMPVQVIVKEVEKRGSVSRDEDGAEASGGNAAEDSGVPVEDSGLPEHGADQGECDSQVSSGAGDDSGGTEGDQQEAE